MKRNLLYVILLILVSCNTVTKNEEVDFSTTEEFQQQKVDVISYKRKRGLDIVQHLYEQALEKDSNLNSLEKKILEINESVQDSLKEYTEYVDYNNLYYQSAYQHIQSIVDSTKRKYFLSYLNDSKKNFEIRITELNNLNKTKSELINELRDQQLIMKLIVSEKLINKYQENEPRKAPLKSIYQRIENLIKESEKYTNSKK